ncbi:MAG: hypothetical protein Q8936_01485 [Bacillota bacterium]|nr:hypothetical protein [Bacillota bacterium]
MKINENGEFILNKQKDTIIMCDNSLKIITDKGIKIDLPYENLILEGENKQISYDDATGNCVIKNIHKKHS